MAAEPGGCEAICLAWARHHFAGADSAVLEYVCSSLAAAVEDGDSLPQLAESLQDFLPPGGSQALLHSGLQELEAALREPGAAQRSYAWLQPQHAAPEASREGGGGAADADAAAAQAPESAQPPPAGRSTLSIGAAEFRPRDDAAALAADLQTLQLGDSGGSQPVDAAAAEWSDATGWAEHPSSSGWQQGGWAEADASSGERWQQQGGQGAADAAADAAAEREMVAGGPEAEEAFLAVLGDQFPLFSDAALRQLFAEQGGSLAATIHTLCGLEAELEGQQQAHGAALGSSCQAAAGPAFSDADFPSLAGPAKGSGANAAPGSATAYASAARAAATRPQQPPSQQPPSGRRAPAAGAAPAPIWKQAEGVQRFATGAAVAQEYQQLRADARDHARLRNAYFQQATQAYLAGNKALAKELGAEGRRHGELMHAAHAAAAAQLFARRNPGAASAGGSSGGGARTIDLHGLHVSEAVQQLEALLQQHRSGVLRLVVGVGQHGKVPARLPAAVKRHLEDRGLQWREPYAGMLEIRL